MTATDRLQLGAHALLYRAYPFERALEGIARAGFAGPCLVERIDGLATPEAIDAALAAARTHLESAAAAAGSAEVAVGSAAGTPRGAIR